jgi:hypothetical protein
MTADRPNQQKHKGQPFAIPTERSPFAADGVTLQPSAGRFSEHTDPFRRAPSGLLDQDLIAEAPRVVQDARTG